MQFKGQLYRNIAPSLLSYYPSAWCIQRAFTNIIPVVVTTVLWVESADVFSSHLAKEEINSWRNQTTHVVCMGKLREPKELRLLCCLTWGSQAPHSKVSLGEGHMGAGGTPALLFWAMVRTPGIPALPGSCWPIWWVPNTLRIFLTWTSCGLTSISPACKDHWFFFFCF